MAPPALAPFSGMDAVAAELTGLVRGGSRDARVHAALGNILIRESRYLDAVEAYRAAAECDGAFAEAHLAASELAYVLRDQPTSDLHRSQALRIRRIFPDPLPVGERIAVLLLLRDAPYAVNTPIELLLDRRRFAIHKYYLGGVNATELPRFDVAFTAFGFALDGAAEIASAFLEKRVVPFINDPRRIGLLARERLEETLARVGGALVVQADRIAQPQLNEEGLMLVRPADTHAGDGLALIDSADELAAHLARFPANEYHVSPFYDYRSSDGYYRKYRVIFVEGIAHPYHLAISPRWMVHYQSAPMREYTWMRDEELRFLSEPQTAIPGWESVMGEISEAVGLDYFGIDVAQLPDGRTLVFEADSGMLVHDEEPNDVFAAKRPFVARIREALSIMVEKRRV